MTSKSHEKKKPETISPNPAVYIVGKAFFYRTVVEEIEQKKRVQESIGVRTFLLDVWQFRQLCVVRFLLLFLFLGD